MAIPILGGLGALFANPGFQAALGIGLTLPAIPGLIQGAGDLVDEVGGTDVMGKRGRASKIRDAAISSMLGEDLELGRQEALQYMGANMLGSLNPGIGNRLPMYGTQDYERARRMGLENTIQSNSNVLRQMSELQSDRPSLRDIAMQMGL